MVRKVQGLTIGQNIYLLLAAAARCLVDSAATKRADSGTKDRTFGTAATAGHTVTNRCASNAANNCAAGTVAAFAAIIAVAAPVIITTVPAVTAIFAVISALTIVIFVIAIGMVAIAAAM